jgi:SRSO17 transposase
LVYDYAEMTVWFSEEGLPAAEPERLLVRRSLGQDAELKFHRSNAPPEVPLVRLAEVRASRWTIEQDIQGGKGECGLDEYETRGWTGWHHHTVLSMLALWFLVLQRLRLGEKRAADERSRGPRPAAAPARPTTLGRGRNPRLVPVETPTKSTGQSLSRKTPSRRVAAAK